MYVIQKVAAAGGMMGFGHGGYCNLYHVDAGVVGGPIATIADERLAERIRDLLNQHGMEGVDMSVIELPPPMSYIGADDVDEEDG